MIDLSKQREFFDPEKVTAPIHIIGVGAIGSHISEQLARIGIKKIDLWDFDVVDKHNIPNQMYAWKDRKRKKVEALHDLLKEINPGMQIKLHPDGYKKGQMLSGHLFLCADNVDLCRSIAETHEYSMNIYTMWDCRLRLTDAQYYAADWKDKTSIKNFIDSMKFTHEEAVAATPVSACGTALSVLPTIRIITALCVANFINYHKGIPIKQMILIDAFEPYIEVIK